MEVTLVVLAGLAFGLVVDLAQRRWGSWVGIVGGVIAFAIAMVLYRGVDQGGLLAFMFGGSYLFSDVLLLTIGRRSTGRHRPSTT